MITSAKVVPVKGEPMVLEVNNRRVEIAENEGTLVYSIPSLNVKNTPSWPMVCALTKAATN